MAILYILCGPAGCGKSTWASKYREAHPAIGYVSRDAVRFAMVKEEEEYFAHEKEVFKEFVKCIAAYLRAQDGAVIADATHLNEFSRRKLTQALDMYELSYDIVYVVFNVDADTCIARNANREGRANVPENIIRNMCRDFRAPTKDEDERVIDIIEVSD